MNSTFGPAMRVVRGVRRTGVALVLFVLVGTAMAQDLNMEEIFRCHGEEPEQTEVCAEARELIINNCTSCHTFVPIVMQQFDREAWEGLLDRHRNRVDHLSDEQVATIHEYLAANFNPDQQPPELPPELLENWTNY